MPETKTKPSGGKGKGKGLTKKVGPLPVYVYLIVGVVLVAYLYYRHRNSGSSSASDQFSGSLNQQTIPSGVIMPASGGSGNGVTDSSGSGTSTAPDWSSVDWSSLLSNPNTFPTDYATQTDLSNAIDSVNNQTAKTVAGITFPTPNINITVPNTGESAPSSKTTATKTAAKKAAVAAAPKKITYYTYKKNVPLKSGQTLHFTKGKGYYAA